MSTQTQESDVERDEHSGPDDAVDGEQRGTPDDPPDHLDAFDRGEDDPEEFTKSVDILAKDDDEQIAIGAVLVPNRVDHQGDYFGKEVIEDQAENLAKRIADRDVLPGVMHSVFPTGHIELASSETLDEAKTIGGRDLPAGTWLVAWHYTNDVLWELVKDEILGGNSIGGTIEADVRYSPDAVPDEVEFPDEVVEELESHDVDPDEVPVWEIKDFRTFEISTVDFPAVPDAVHVQTKTTGAAAPYLVPTDARSLMKAAPMLTENEVSARVYLEARGHSESEAQRLAAYLNEHKAKAASRADRGGILTRTKQWFTNTPTTTDGTDTETDGLADTDERNASVADLLADIESKSDEEAESSRDADADGDAVLKTMDQDELEDKFDTLEAQQEKTNEALENLPEQIANAVTEEEAGKNTEDEPTIEDLFAQLQQMDETQQELAQNQRAVTQSLVQMAEASGASQQTRNETTLAGEGQASEKATFLGLAGGD